MSAIAITLFVSLCLAGMFVVFFCADSRQRRQRGGFEREALLPLDDGPFAQTPVRPAEPATPLSQDPKRDV